eukprot:CAMPEP_0178450354 /NCGR_PEP_ID=MMETSP0689_2-20121128/43077_1 /TAXON_ID=160604 /ORGANISM="Amphidinium massartii, Strain CS-259" /LENGTH=31 /DNA_ID= /DNA_START= /DNA_END= /DNA_ORIENTATION=
MAYTVTVANSASPTELQQRLADNVHGTKAGL